MSSISSLSQDIFNQINQPGASARANQANSDAQNIQDRFLTLLMAQLKGQDPMNPMENFEITSQMAQISAVTGTEKMNQSINMLLQSQYANQSMMAAGMIGRSVMTDGNNLDIETAGDKTRGAVELAAPADKVSVSVLDKAGNVVSVINVQNPKSGINYFDWNGLNQDGTPAPAGEYTYKIEASRAGEAVTANPLALSKVKGVTWEGGIPQLMLANGKTSNMADIVQIV